MSLEWSGYSTVPFTGFCYGEDSQLHAQYGGRPKDYLAPGEQFSTLVDVCTPRSDPALHEGNGGGLALRVTATGKRNAQLQASITSPSGKVYTHGPETRKANVCASETIWTHIPDKPEPVGDGALEAGQWLLCVENVGRRNALGVTVEFYGFMGYTMAAQCPIGDVVVR